MRHRRTARGLGLLGALVLALPAAAYLPAPDRIANEVAKGNRAAGRGVPLALTVELRMGEVDAVLAKGTLVSAPGGSMRLELESPRGTWERHLRRGGAVRASRLGEILDQPRPFLAPFHLLQAGTAGRLQTGLIELGARTGQVALGYEGPHVCWVIGGRRPGPGAPDRASVWIDQETVRIVRVDQEDGVSYLLGPPKVFGKIQVPAWIDVRVRDSHLARLTVRGAKPIRLAEGTFDPAWLGVSPAP